MSSKKYSLFKQVNSKALQKLIGKTAPVYNWAVNAKASIGNEVLPIFGLEPLPDPITYHYDEATESMVPSTTMKAYAAELSNWGTRNKQAIDIAGKQINVPIDIPIDDINSVLQVIAADGTPQLQRMKKVNGEWVKEGPLRAVNPDGTLPVNSGAQFSKWIFGGLVLFIIYKILK